MKTGSIVFAISLVVVTLLSTTHAQRACSTFTYIQQQLQADPSLAAKMQQIEDDTRRFRQGATTENRPEQDIVIKIPVVVHVLFHSPGENDLITDQKIQAQIDILNRCFRRKNSDTLNTPTVFRSLAADCEFEFYLATSDPRRKNTTGIVRKYSPVSEWQADDKMKLSVEMGDDAWDPSSYLNIWVCNLQRVAGYASMPGGDAAKDGVVISFNVWGPTSTVQGLNEGKTLVHEVGHWLNLKHLWGDDYCGDDGVQDTPVQGGYNYGCPTGSHVTCSNGPHGDMYMNYMDFTNDACINMFTLGQKARMKALFAPGGKRYSILSSTGLQPPLFYEAPLPVEQPRWLRPQLFPNPAGSFLTLDLTYDSRWIGKTIQLVNMQGRVVKQELVTSKVHQLNISALAPGMYLLISKKEDGDFIREKFIKL